MARKKSKAASLGTVIRLSLYASTTPHDSYVIVIGEFTLDRAEKGSEVWKSNRGKNQEPRIWRVTRLRVAE